MYHLKDGAKVNAGHILESKGVHVIFQKKGKKC